MSTKMMAYVEPNKLQPTKSDLNSLSSDKNTLVSTSSSSGINDNSSNLKPISLSDYASFTEKEITIIRTTWVSNVAKIDDVLTSNIKGALRPTSSMIASQHFWRQVYEDLLGQHPDLKDVFPSIKHQTVSFSGIVYTAVMNLENLTVMNNFLENLGRRHSRVFGAEPIYFQYMGCAFIDTLSERFGELFTPDVESAWIKLYCFLSNSIILSGNTNPIVLNNEQDDFNTFMSTAIQENYINGINYSARESDETLLDHHFIAKKKSFSTQLRNNNHHLSKFIDDIESSSEMLNSLSEIPESRSNTHEHSSKKTNNPKHESELNNVSIPHPHNISTPHSHRKKNIFSFRSRDRS